MGRVDFGRTPMARAYDDDTIFIPSIPDGPVIDDNSPMSTPEIHFDDDENRRRSTHLDFHNNAGEQELELVCGYNATSREELNQSLAEVQAIHGPVNTITVTMAIQNARSHALFFLQNGFKRAADRSHNTWTYTCDLEEHRTKKRERPKMKKPKVQEPEVKPEPIVVKMTIEQYREAEQKRIDLLAEIDRLRRLRDEHAGKDIT